MLVSGAPDLSPLLLPMEVPVVIRTTVPSRGGISLLEPLAVSSLGGGGCWALITLLCGMMSQDTLLLFVSSILVFLTSLPSSFYISDFSLGSILHCFQGL